jgi:transcriptional regulator with XRE-family HTH domain
MDLKAARKQKGWSQFDLEEHTGVAAHNISALETGSRIMGKRLAGKFAEHLDTDSIELLIANRAAAMERAIRENDVPTVNEPQPTRRRNGTRGTARRFGRCKRP